MLAGDVTTKLAISAGRLRALLQDKEVIGLVSLVEEVFGESSYDCDSKAQTDI
jgi:hypothetical protein